MGDDTATAETSTRKPKSSESFGRVVWRRFRRSRAGMFGLVVTGIFLLMGFFAPALASDKPLLCRYKGTLYAPALWDVVQSNIPFGHSMRFLDQAMPFNQATFNPKRALERDMKADSSSWAIWPPVAYGPTETSRDALEGPSASHWLGTDRVGRDLTARMIHGARISMLVGFVSVGIATLLGLILGSLSGYYGGQVDNVISRLIEIWMCFPVLILVLTVLAIVAAPNILWVMLVIGLVTWTRPARYVRGEFIRLRDSEYAMAARALGAGSGRIIFRHILPNALAPLFVTVSFGIAAAILLEASLSFLGIGVAPETASWGNVLQRGFANIQTTGHMIWPPSVAIFFGVLSYNLVGDALRDAIDPRLQT